MLYIAMEDFEMDIIVGQGIGARNVRIPLPRFTLVGATTKPGSVSAPLHTRFGITIRINPYTQQELQAIIRRSAKLLHITISTEASLLLAQCARGTPRVANRLLKRVRDFAQVHQKPKSITLSPLLRCKTSSGSFRTRGARSFYSQNYYQFLSWWSSRTPNTSNCRWREC